MLIQTIIWIFCIKSKIYFDFNKHINNIYWTFTIQTKEKFKVLAHYLFVLHAYTWPILNFNCHETSLMFIYYFSIAFYVFLYHIIC